MVGQASQRQTEWNEFDGENYSRDKVRHKMKETISCIRNDDVGGRARMTRDEERVLRGGMTLCRYGGWVVDIFVFVFAAC